MNISGRGWVFVFFLPNVGVFQESFLALILVLSKIKNVLVTAPVLKFYNANKNVTLSVDESSKSLGIAVFQKGQPVAYTTVVLTKQQMNWT